MAEPADSFKQFNYSLRPSKQVERKIMIEILLRLSAAGYNISQYKYWGFGSVYYVDFVMFHKYLFIDEMTCVEWGDVKKRMRFNKPFTFIRLKLGPLSRHIPSIRPKDKSLVWLDYDRALDPEMLQDIDGTVGRLSPKSLFVITVDARPRLPKSVSGEVLRAAELESLTAETYSDWFSQYLGRAVERGTVSSVHVAPLFYEVVTERISRTIKRRGEGLQFIQLFNYLYRDGAPMWPLGGMVGTAEDWTTMKEKGAYDHRFVRVGPEYLEISVPPLTMREKQWLDCHLDGKLTAKKLRFELDEELLQNYCRFYREYPVYLESLL